MRGKNWRKPILSPLGCRLFLPTLAFLGHSLFPTGSWHCLNGEQMQASAPLLVGV